MIKLRVNLQSQPDPTSEGFNDIMILFIHHFHSFVISSERERQKINKSIGGACFCVFSVEIPRQV